MAAEDPRAGNSVGDNINRPKAAPTSGDVPRSPGALIIPTAGSVPSSSSPGSQTPRLRSRGSIDQGRRAEAERNTSRHAEVAEPGKAARTRLVLEYRKRRANAIERARQLPCCWGRSHGDGFHSAHGRGGTRPTRDLRDIRAPPGWGRVRRRSIRRSPGRRPLMSHGHPGDARRLGGMSWLRCSIRLASSTTRTLRAWRHTSARRR